MFSATNRNRSTRSEQQRGAAGVEFTLAFPLFFVLFYAIVGYGLIMTVDQSLTTEAAEGARSAVAADPKRFDNDLDYQQTVTSLARNRAAAMLNWLPASVKSAVLGDAPDYNKVQTTVGESGTNPRLRLISVTLTYPYAEAPLLPILTLPVIGQVPNVPENIVATSQAQLYRISP